MKIILPVCSIIFLLIAPYSSSPVPQSAGKKEMMYGVTVNSVNNLTDTKESLVRMKRKPTVRIVFDEWEPVKHYTHAVKELHKVSHTMGEILDSYSMDEYGIKDYIDRVKEYADGLGDDIDIWEIGNEVNGEWNGSRRTVGAKIEAAYNYVKSSKRKTAITLYYNDGCYESRKHEMFAWTDRNIPDYMKMGLDYVFVSYYEDNCGEPPDWQIVFDSLKSIFPNSKLGIGECGTKDKSAKEQMMKRYYGMSLQNPNFIGGYFWWYYQKDCVPYTKQLWKVMNEAIGN